MIWGKFSAGVYINDQQLDEFCVTVSNTPSENRLTCWIPSQAGQYFEVRGAISAPQSSGIHASVSVDGFECPPWVVQPPWTGTVEFDCLSDGTVGRKLMFKDIQFTDDESMMDPESNEIGEIILTLQRGRFNISKPRRSRKSRTARKRKTVRKPKDNNHILPSCMGERMVDERLKKGRAHQVSLGEEVPDREEQTSYHHEFDPDYPVTTFIFKYTSLEILRAKGRVA
ncbi:hypothetical protein DEU56DRAFT_820315 [Suillus clintonianus]|uniref:uncharacterized protein n=1 Tax=Suillus clintonianus TaxID=1904413 RepID=UPI001B886359|nr:uncharacterized protein DEU56DRAFT_820315 [Suillus clintonianus]KAG2127490.1 hypothetical protein DEU56DRAFT_820315 [Suillus clintonianus]